jgi:hypothetical protein
MVVANQLHEGQMARKQWEILSERYSRTDLLSQYELRARVRLEKLKDANDAPCYLGVFENACCRFIQMGITYSNAFLICCRVFQMLSNGKSSRSSQ